MYARDLPAGDEPTDASCADDPAGKSGWWRQVDIEAEIADLDGPDDEEEDEDEDEIGCW